MAILIAGCNFAIKKLREALGDKAEQPRYIQTLRNARYRFIAPVRESHSGSTVSQGQANPAKPDSGGVLPSINLFPHRRPQLLALMTGVIIAVAAATLALRSHDTDKMTPFSSPLAASGHAELEPKIAGVTSIVPQPRQRIVINGRGFGLHVPYVRTDSPYLAIRDETADWAAGRIIPQNHDEVMLDVESWTDTEIVISGFSGDYGRNGWKLSPGDSLEVAVWNPQSGVGHALYRLAVSANAP